jgi:hypothetical protein
MTSNGQYALVNFPNSGTAVITLTSVYAATGCLGTTSIDVNVAGSVADNPLVIYDMGMFICLENDEDTYQWGYDDASTFASYSIPGAVNQSYSNSNVDFNQYNYWVITTHNGCTQKTYYNAPKVNAASHKNADPGLKVYPNPVTDNVFLELTNSSAGNMVFEVVNMMGQKLITGSANDTKATINASGLTPGAYIINCYLNGSKLATTRFIKN